MISSEKANRSLYFQGINLYLIGVVISLLSLFIGVSVYFDSPQHIYEYIYLLPIVFGILNYFFIKIYKKITIVTCIILFFEFIRCVVTPAILMLEGYPKGLYQIYIIEDNIYIAMFLMLAEMFFIFYSLYKMRNYSEMKLSDTRILDNLFSRKNYSSLGPAALFVIFLFLCLIIIFPSLSSIYSFILSSNLDAFTDAVGGNLGNAPKGLGWIGSILGELTRAITIQFFIVKLYKMYVKKMKIRYFFYSIFIVLSNSAIITSSMIMSMLPNVVFFFELYLLYPTKRKEFLYCVSSFACVILAVVIGNYLKAATTYHSISQIIQDYTNGYYSVYQGICAYDNRNMDNIDKYLMFFLGDGIANISPLNVILKFENSSNIFNYYLYATQFNGGAVLPYVSQCSFYFSYILGPVFVVIPIFFAKKFECLWINGNGNFLFWGLLALILALTPFLYNYSTFIRILSVTCIPLWIVYKLNCFLVYKS